MPNAMPRILLVDDSLDELRLLSDMLRSAQYRVLVATDGRQGYQRAVTVTPDLILMDVVMPQMDGLTACRLLKVDPATRHIPVIFLSAKNAPEERLQGLRAGGVDYVSKPFMEEEVILRVHVHMGGAAQTPLPPEDARRMPDTVLAQAAVHIIQDRLEALPPVAEIASMVGTYEKKLVRIFRQEYKMSVSMFIREERIRVARQLLTDTEMSVHKIGELVGMDNAANFATAFRDRMGMSPSHYRDASREASQEAQ
jgi:CheY-like chemotaxis protein